MSEFKITPLTPEQEEKINEHLAFIEHVTNHSIKYGYRTIISGGYAVDGVIGKITRPHADTDIQLYGNDVLNTVLLESMISVGVYEGFKVEDREENEYYHTFFVPEINAEIYYLRVATKPFTDTKIIFKSDGKYTEEEDFGTKVVYLKGVRYEVQSPITELVDKMYKREYRGDAKLPKHDQDIYNLKQITEPYEVEMELKRIVKRSQK